MNKIQHLMSNRIFSVIKEQLGFIEFSKPKQTLVIRGENNSRLIIDKLHHCNKTGSIQVFTNEGSFFTEMHHDINLVEV